MSDRSQPFGLTDASLILVAVLWGINYSVVKYGSKIVTAGPFTLLRVAVAAMTLLVVATLQRKPWPSRRDMLALVALGVLGNGGYQLLFVNGVVRTRIADAALILAAAPALIAVVSAARGIERVSGRAIAGIGLSITGVAFVILTSTRAGHGQSTGLGVLLMSCAVVCWSFYIVTLRTYALRVDIVQLNAITMVGGVLPLLAWVPATIARPWATIPVSVWASVAYAGAISMGLAYLFWYRGIRVLGPTRTSIYGNMQPVVAIAVAWAVLAEAPTVWQVVGASAILGGIFLTRT